MWALLISNHPGPLPTFLVPHVPSSHHRLLQDSQELVKEPAESEAQANYLAAEAGGPAIDAGGWTSIIDVVDCGQFKENKLLSPDEYLAPPPAPMAPPLKDPEPRFATHTDNSFNRLVETIVAYPTISVPQEMTLAGNFASAATATKRRTQQLHRTKGKGKGKAATSATAEAKTARLATSQLAAAQLAATATATAEAAVPVFIVSPAVINFDKYAIGDTLTATITLTNTSTSTRHVALEPPKSSAFFLQRLPNPQRAGAKNVDPSGGIAAGLSCQYLITFTPISLAEIHDTLSVKAEGRLPFSVDILAKRPTPRLGLPKELSCGACQLGTEQVEFFECCNTGATGRFRVVRVDDVPETPEAINALDDAWWTEDPGLKLSLFGISPTSFQLGSGDTSRLRVHFDACERGIFTTKFAVVKDNCEVVYLTVNGSCEAPDVSIVGVSSEEPGISASGVLPQTAKIEFAPIHPAESLTHEVTISNDTFLDVPFSWSVCQAAETSGVPSSNFEITPEVGTMAGHSTQKFTFRYLSDKPQTIKTRAYLNIPAPEGSEAALQPSESTAAVVIDLAAECRPFTFEVMPPLLDFPGELDLDRVHSRDIRIDNTSAASLRYDWAEFLDEAAAGTVTVKPSAGAIAAKASQRFEITVRPHHAGPIRQSLKCSIGGGQTIELPVTANIKPIHVDLEVPSINFGVLRAGEPVGTSIPVRNFSGVDAEWELSLETEAGAGVVELTPSSGSLPPFGEVEVQVTFKPDKPCKLVDRIVCKVQDGTLRYTEIVGAAETPAACLVKSRADFGTAYVGVVMEATIQVQNLTNLRSAYATETHETDSFAVSFATPSGALEPASTQDLTVLFTAKTTGEARAVVHLLVDGMKEPLCLEVVADVRGLSVDYQCPLLTAEDGAVWSGEVDFGLCPAYTPSQTRVVTLTNTSGVAADYRFSVLGFQGLLDEKPDVEEVAPLERDDLTKTIPAFLKRTRSTATATATTTAGKGPPKAAPPSAKKTTALPAFMRRRASTPSGGSAPPSRVATTTPSITSSQIVDRSASEQGQYREALQMLQNRKGLAFKIYPTEATLPSHGSISVMVRCCGDTWGKYRDVLRCETDDLELHDIPLHVEVTGSPLVVQAAASTATPMVVRMPSVSTSADSSDSAVDGALISSAISDRVVRITNPSPFDIRADWSCFHVQETLQLIDFLWSAEDADGKVSVRHRPHEGYLCLDNMGPFGVSSSKTIVIPGRSSLNVPGTNLGINFRSAAQGNFHGFVRGNVELANDAAVARAIGLSDEAVAAGVTVDRSIEAVEAISVKVLLSCRAVTPALSSVSGEDRLAFEGALLDAFESGESSSTKTITFSNTTEAELCCTISAAAPFFVHSVTVVQKCNPKLVKVPPGSAMQIIVGHRFKFDDVLQCSTSGQQDDICPAAGALQIRFADQTEMEIPLVARVFLPLLEATTRAIDFGCVRGSKSSKFTLRNGGRSSIPWTLAITGSDAFTCSQCDGVLDGFTSRVAKITELVDVTFAPPKTGDHRATLSIASALSERVIEVALSGSGTSDGSVHV